MALVMPEGASQTANATLPTVTANAGGQLVLENSWKQYYQAEENPLSAPAAAMLNIHGEQSHGSSLAYEGYALKPPPQPNNLGPPLTVPATRPDMWSEQMGTSLKPAASIQEKSDVFLNDVKKDPGSPDRLCQKSPVNSQVFTSESPSPAETKEVGLDDVPLSILVQVKQEPSQPSGNPPISNAQTTANLAHTQAEPKSPYSPAYATVQQTHSFGDIFSALSGNVAPQAFVTTVPSKPTSPQPVFTDATAPEVGLQNTTTGHFYRDYYQGNGDFSTRAISTSQQQALTVTAFPTDVLSNASVTTTTLSSTDPLFVERYIRQSSQSALQLQGYKASLNGLTVDLPSPDSGIGETMTPREPTGLPQIFDYSDIPNSTTPLIGSSSVGTPVVVVGPLGAAQVTTQTVASVVQTELVTTSRTSQRCRSWHDYGRANESDKILIPKMCT